MSGVLIKLASLWERERRGNPGNTYWTGRLGAAKLLVFKNHHKQGPDDPDYNVFITEPSPPRQEQPPAYEAQRGRATDQASREIGAAWSRRQQDERVQELARRFDRRPPDTVDDL
jgi:hypothetical protein